MPESYDSGRSSYVTSRPAKMSTVTEEPMPFLPVSTFNSNLATRLNYAAQGDEGLLPEKGFPDARAGIDWETHVASQAPSAHHTSGHSGECGSGGYGSGGYGRTKQ